MHHARAISAITVLVAFLIQPAATRQRHQHYHAVMDQQQDNTNDNPSTELHFLPPSSSSATWPGLVAGEHLAIGDEPATLTVAWHTDIAAPGVPCVVWAPTTTNPPATNIQAPAAATACGSTQTYLISPNRTAFLHNAAIGPLQPNKQYVYHVEHGNGAAKGITYTFTAPQTTPTTLDTDADGTTKAVIFFGDSGHSHEWHNRTVPAVAAEVAAGNVSAIVHTGDMAYYSKDEDGLRGQYHAEELSNATGHVVPLMTIPGNGDVFCYRPPGIPDWAACTEDYQRRYIGAPRGLLHEGVADLFYTDVCSILMVVRHFKEADTWCQSSQNKTQQLEFAEADLSNVNRKETPWVVAAVHRPLYSSCDSTKEQQTMRDGFAALFTKHGVDMVVNGHVHSYERTWPTVGDYTNITNATVQRDGGGGGGGITRDHYLNPKYPVHVIAGTAGNGESIDDCSKGAALYNWTFSAVRSNDIGYGKLRAANGTHLEVSFYSVTQSKQIDHFWIEKTIDTL